MKNFLLSLVVSVLCSTAPMPASGHATPAHQDMLDMLDFECDGPSHAPEVNEANLSPDELRRYRNKIAAKKCRQKRKERQNGIEVRAEHLTLENAELRAKNDRLMAAIQHLQATQGLVLPAEFDDLTMTQPCMRGKRIKTEHPTSPKASWSTYNALPPELPMYPAHPSTQQQQQQQHQRLSDDDLWLPRGPAAVSDSDYHSSSSDDDTAAAAAAAAAAAKVGLVKQVTTGRDMHRTSSGSESCGSEGSVLCDADTTTTDEDLLALLEGSGLPGDGLDLELALDGGVLEESVLW